MSWNMMPNSIATAIVDVRAVFGILADIGRE